MAISNPTDVNIEYFSKSGVNAQNDCNIRNLCPVICLEISLCERRVNACVHRDSNACNIFKSIKMLITNELNLRWMISHTSLITKNMNDVPLLRAWYADDYNKWPDYCVSIPAYEAYIGTVEDVICAVRHLCTNHFDYEMVCFLREIWSEYKFQNYLDELNRDIIRTDLLIEHLLLNARFYLN